MRPPISLVLRAGLSGGYCFIQFVVVRAPEVFRPSPPRGIDARLKPVLSEVLLNFPVLLAPGVLCKSLLSSCRPDALFTKLIYFN